MYIAIINGWNDILSFNEDKETAKNQAIEKARELYEDEINAPYGLESWTWENIAEYFGCYILDINENAVLTTEGIKAGMHDKYVLYN